MSLSQVDNVEHPSWQAQLRGRKKWTIEPPPECYYQCRRLEVTVEPGQIRKLCQMFVRIYGV